MTRLAQEHLQCPSWPIRCIAASMHTLHATRCRATALALVSPKSCSKGFQRPHVLCEQQTLYERIRPLKPSFLVSPPLTYLPFSTAYRTCWQRTCHHARQHLWHERQHQAQHQPKNCPEASCRTETPKRIRAGRRIGRLHPNAQQLLQSCVSEHWTLVMVLCLQLPGSFLHSTVNQGPWHTYAHCRHAFMQA